MHFSLAHAYLHLIAPAIMLLLAGFYFTIAFRAWRFKRPFLISQRWMFGLILVGFSPSFLNPFLLMRPASSAPLPLTFLLWLNPLMMGALAVFLWFTMRGYLVFAVTENSFRDAFLSAVTRFGYTCEERLSSMRLLPIDVTIQVTVQGWMGTGFLRIKSGANAPLLPGIADEMNAYWKAHGGETNQVTSGVYAVLVWFLGAIAVVLGLLKF